MLPGYVVSTMVRALRELTGVGINPVREAGNALDELSTAELDQVVKAYAEILGVAQARRDLRAIREVASQR